jgi:hypothetical protein
MTLFVTDTISPPPSDKEIASVQDYFDVKFPKEYLSMLQNANGAKLKNPILQTKKREIVIERFLPILDDVENDPNGWADVSVVDTQIGDRLATDGDSTGLELIPIAALFAGDFLVLDYRQNKDEPSVGIWDHEQSEYLNPHVETIAPSFAAFLKMLH